jgi:hypothetical protein
MLLAFRQLYTSERFKPFVNPMVSISGKLGTSEKDSIISIGDRTRGWLGVIESFIKLSRNGIVSPEETILAMLKQPDILINDKVPAEITGELAVFIKSMWGSYFNTETGRYGKNILEKVIGISESVEKFQIENIVIAIPSLSKSELNRIFEECAKTKAKTQIIPKLEDLMTGKLSVNTFRDVEVEDYTSLTKAR